MKNNQNQTISTRKRISSSITNPRLFQVYVFGLFSLLLATISCPPSSSPDKPGATMFPFICPDGTPNNGTTASENTTSCSDCTDPFTLVNDDQCIPPTMFPFICPNGTPNNGTTASENTTSCSACTDPFTLVNDDQCIQAPTMFSFICPNGTPNNGTTASENTISCSGCTDPFTLVNDQCIQPPMFSFICPNGTPNSGTTASENTTSCSGCTDPFTLVNDDQCMAVTGMFAFTCENGEAKSGSTNTAMASCKSCSSGFLLVDSSRCSPPPSFQSKIGASGSGDGQFNAPNEIVFRTDDTNGAQIIVVDSGNNRVQLFNTSGGYQSQGTTAAGVQGIESTPTINTTSLVNAQFYFLSTSTRIHVYSVTDNAEANSAAPGTMSNPRGMAITPPGEPFSGASLKKSTLYVVDGGNHRVAIWFANFALREGNLDALPSFGRISEDPGFFGSMGNGDGQFNSPKGIEIDGSGLIYVTDSGNHRVQVFSSSRDYMTQFGSMGSGNGQFNDPNGIAFDADGNVYIVDTGNNRVQIFDSNHEYRAQFGSMGSGDGQFNNPNGITIDPTGNIYIVDTGNDRVQVFAHPSE